MATLYQLTNEYLDLLAMMEDPEVDPQIVADTMEGIEGELEDKAESYCIIMKELEAEKAKWDAEVKRAEKHSSSIESHIKNMKSALMASMQATGKDKLPTEHFKLAIQKNGGLAPLILKGEVPAEYCRMEPDNAKIREALKDGALDFAELGERGVHLVCR